MNIEKVKKSGENSYIINNQFLVPIDSQNAEFNSILEWVKNGGIIEPEFTNEELFEKAKEAKKNTLLENYNLEIAKPHPIDKAPKLDKLNKPDGFTDAEFKISNPDILKQETTIVFGGLFLSNLKYLELINANLLSLLNKFDQDLLKLKIDILKLNNITPDTNLVPENQETIKKAFNHEETMMRALNSSIPIPYPTKDKKGEEVKIALTGAENFSIFKHLFVRISAKSSQLDLIKNQIENAKTPEELEKINVNF
jgi:hypothetical protein